MHPPGEFRQVAPLGNQPRLYASKPRLSLTFVPASGRLFQSSRCRSRHCPHDKPARSKFGSTAAKLTSLVPNTVVTREQRRPCIESGSVAATHAVTAGVAAIVIARR